MTNLKTVLCRFFQHKVWSNWWFMLLLWMVLAIFSASKNPYENNFLIFRYSFIHAMEGATLYGPSPSEYLDVFLYGPLFTVLVAPFAVLPVWVGHLLWQVAMTAVLYLAVRSLPIANGRKVFIIWFCANELLTALFLSQFNIAIAAILLFSFCAVEKERDEWATLAVVIGTFTKVYGIVGLAFFFFSKHKKRYVLSLLVWSALAFVLPMLVTSPEYVISQYQGWADALGDKNTLNLYAIDENICLLGIVRKVVASVAIGTSAVRALEAGTVQLSQLPLYSDLWLILPAMAVAATGYFRIGQWKNAAFRETVLADIMMFVLLFSTGSESYGYIIALIGVVIWYTASPWKRNRWDVALMVFAFVLTSLSPGDLFPADLRNDWVKPYALKALPVALIWFKLSYELIVRDYSITENGNYNER